jgi:chromosome partitioning protein
MAADTSKTRTKKRPLILTVANEKGGVGKTTLALHLATGLAQEGRQVLLLDMDPQANLTTGLGFVIDNKVNPQPFIYDYLMGTVSISDAILDVEGIHLIPSSRDLVGASIQLQQLGPKLLHDAFAESPELGDYDYVVIDSPPSLDIFTRLCLVASDQILGAVQSEFFSLDGLTAMNRTMVVLRQQLRRPFFLGGVVMTRHMPRKTLNAAILRLANERFPGLVFDQTIREDTNFGKASAHGQSIYSFAPDSNGTKDYRGLVREFLDRAEKRRG